MSLYQRIVGRLCRLLFPLARRLGFYVIPNHFYQPIPNIDSLPHDRKFSCTALNLADWQGELEPMRQYFKERIPVSGSFGAIDADVLYAIVRKEKPKRIVEIGSGTSTGIIDSALEKNRIGSRTSYDPFGDSRCIHKRAQDVPAEQLAGCDLLFIDSTHVATTGSDVVHLVLNVLPLLAPGTLVHFHDIFWPVDYPQWWIEKLHLFWNEQYVVHAFLLFNPHFQIIWSGSFMHINHRPTLEKIRPYSDPHHPGSLWLRRNHCVQT
jgi:hypothetical protein